MGSGAAWSKRWRDDLLGQAVRALREQADADAPDAIESWQAMDAWRDVSGDLRRANRRRRIKLIVALQALVGLGGVGAWAAVSGRLPPLFSRAVRAIRPPAAPSRPLPTWRAPGASLRSRNLPRCCPPRPSRRRLIRRRRRRPAAPMARQTAACGGAGRCRASGPAGAPVAPASDDIYARAHHAQFAAHDYAAALTLAG